jgi:hypothetical protein
MAPMLFEYLQAILAPQSPAIKIKNRYVNGRPHPSSDLREFRADQYQLDLIGLQ